MKSKFFGAIVESIKDKICYTTKLSDNNLAEMALNL
jgi:hypothetical protein